MSRAYAAPACVCSSYPRRKSHKSPYKQYIMVWRMVEFCVACAFLAVVYIVGKFAFGKFRDHRRERIAALKAKRAADQLVQSGFQGTIPSLLHVLPGDEAWTEGPADQQLTVRAWTVEEVAALLDAHREELGEARAESLRTHFHTLPRLVRAALLLYCGGGWWVDVRQYAQSTTPLAVAGAPAHQVTPGVVMFARDTASGGPLAQLWDTGVAFLTGKTSPYAEERLSTGVLGARPRHALLDAILSYATERPCGAGWFDECYALFADRVPPTDVRLCTKNSSALFLTPIPCVTE